MPETNISDTELTEDEYEAECAQVELLFPNAKFTISINIEELENVISDQPRLLSRALIVIVTTSSLRAPTFFYIRGENIQ